MNLLDLVPWYYRWAALVLLLIAFGTTCWLKGVEHCEQREVNAEANARKHSDVILADNRKQQNDLQSKLEEALTLLGRMRHACLDVPHPSSVECVLNLRTDGKACP